RTAQCPPPPPIPPLRRLPAANEPACLMNQTRTFLIFAWLMVATLLWMEWGKEQRAPETPVATAVDGAGAAGSVPGAPPTGAAAASGGPATPGAVPSAPLAAQVPVPGVAAAPATSGPADLVQVRTDVLDLALRGGVVARADLLQYPQTRDEGSAPVRLFDDNPASFYAAQSGWVSQANAAPSHESGFVPA